MDNIAGSKSSLTWVVHISVVLLVALWLFPTVGLLVSSFRTADQIATGGWWKAMLPAEQNQTFRATDPDDEGAQSRDGDLYVIEGNVFEGAAVGEISVWGTSSREIERLSGRRDRRSRRRRDADGSGKRRLSPDLADRDVGQGPTDIHHCRDASGFYHAELQGRAVHRRVGRGHGEGVLQHVDRDDPGDDHSDPDRGFRGLCAGVDGFSGAGAADRRRRGAAWWCRCNWR